MKRTIAWTLPSLALGLGLANVGLEKVYGQTPLPQTGADATAPSSSSNPTPTTNPALSSENAAGSNRNNATPRARQLTSRRSSAPNRRLTSTPYMVGDVFGAGETAIGLRGGFGPVNLEHPAMGGERLNLAEGNSPLLGDRVFLSYRHFHDASEVSILAGQATGSQQSVPLDVWIFGFERMILDQTSLEFRLPIMSGLSADPSYRIVNTGNGPATTSFPGDASDSRFGNLSFSLKQSLVASSNFQLTAGMGLSLPTGEDVNARGQINNAQFPTDPNPIGTPATTPAQFQFRTTVENETVNLVPYVGFVFSPTERVFTQGFFQYDVPLNSSTVTIQGSGSAPQLGLNSLPRTIIDELSQQELLRLNWGVGTWIWKNDTSSLIHSAALMGELHYTTTTEDADIIGGANGAELVAPADQGFAQTSVQVGNLANRIDYLNMVIAVPIMIGQTSISNGFAVPIRSYPDQAFTFEYNLAIHRRF